MPMLYVAICEVCGTKSEPTVGAPTDWIMLNVPEIPSLYFDKLSCLAEYAAAQAPTVT